MPDSLQLHGLYPARLLYSWDSAGKNTGVGCHSLLLGIFSTRDQTRDQINPPALKVDSLPSEPPGKAHNLQIAAMFTLLMLSPVHLFATLWTVAHQASLSMEFSRQEYWCGLPFLTPGDLPHLGNKPTSLGLLLWQVHSLTLRQQGSLHPYFLFLTLFP